MIILTARSYIADKIYHLDLGADDYISKPFSFDELDARCRAVLRRHQNKGDNLIQFGDLSYDQKMQIAWIGDEQLKLRAREMQLLSIFLDNPKNIFSKMQLVDKLVTLNDDISPNAVEVHIGRLRNKILPAHVTITAGRGIGYAKDIPALLNFNPITHKPKKFLKPNSKLKYDYRKKFKKLAKGKMIIGISNAKKGSMRYINWQYWQPILTLDNALFINLEYDATSKKYFEKYAQKNDYNVITLQEPHPIVEFDYFTSLASACDMIICGATTLQHQVGSLGIPSFVLLIDKPVYFDKIGGDKSVWYENQYYIRATDYQINNKRPNYKKMMLSASEKIKTYIDQNF